MIYTTSCCNGNCLFSRRTWFIQRLCKSELVNAILDYIISSSRQSRGNLGALVEYFVTCLISVICIGKRTISNTDRSWINSQRIDKNFLIIRIEFYAQCSSGSKTYNGVWYNIQFDNVSILETMCRRSTNNSGYSINISKNLILICLQQILCIIRSITIEEKTFCGCSKTNFCSQTNIIFTLIDCINFRS